MSRPVRFGDSGTFRLFYRIAYAPALILVLLALVDISISLPDPVQDSVFSFVILGAAVLAVVAAIANGYLGGQLLASVANIFSIPVGFFGVGFINEATGNVEPSVHGTGPLDYVLIIPYLLVLGSLGAIVVAVVAFAVGRVLRRLVPPSSISLDNWFGAQTTLPSRSGIASIIVGDPETSGQFYRIAYWLAATFILVGYGMVQAGFPLASLSFMNRSLSELLLWSFALLAFAVSVANALSDGGLAASVVALLSLVVGFVGVGLVTSMTGSVRESVTFYDSLGASSLIVSGGIVYALFLGVVGYAIGVGIRDLAQVS